jgi:diaminopimelate epimerase
VTVKFAKMHGLGNDFVVIDAVRQTVRLTPEAARQLADRHFGIGCDQILLVEPPRHPEADFQYRIFNADGGEVNQCGNGARCFARFVHEQGLSDKPELRVDTAAGPLLLRRELDGNITVNMGIPRHAPAEIPLAQEREASRYSVEMAGQTWWFGAVSMGNPHAVLLVDDVDQAPVKSLGARLERHPLFPERANIGFLQVMDRGHARLRVFERGSGETLACGSGACAAAVIGMEQGLLDSAVNIQLTGGPLHIRWPGRGRPVLMTGPAVTVFEGVIEWPK